MNKITIVLLAILLIVTLSACGAKRDADASGYQSISQEDAKKLMEDEKDYVILDVRTKEEYDEVHIPGATLLPVDAVSEQAEEILPDKDQLILVYCRSGNRSKRAAKQLAKLGYTKVKEFGGINTWKYETE